MKNSNPVNKTANNKLIIKTITAMLHPTAITWLTITLRAAIALISMQLLILGVSTGTMELMVSVKKKISKKHPKETKINSTSF